MKRILLLSAVFILCLLPPAWTVASEGPGEEQVSCGEEITEEIIEQEPCEEETEETEPEEEIEEIKGHSKRPQRDIKYEIDKQLQDTGLEFERYYPGEARPAAQSYRRKRPQIEPFVFVEDDDEEGGAKKENEKKEATKNDNQKKEEGRNDEATD